MGKFKGFINKLIVNYVYGIKTQAVPDINLPLDLKTIAFARNNRNRIEQVLEFQEENWENWGGSKLPISLDTLNERANSVFNAISDFNNNFLNLATPQNIDNPNFSTNNITQEMADTFDSIDLDVLSSEELLKHRGNREILEFLRDNKLEVNDYVAKGISVASNGGNLDEFKKFVDLKGMTEILGTIPDGKFTEGEYQKFVDLYGDNIPKMKEIGDFLDILVKLNLENDEKYKTGLSFINKVIERTGVDLVRTPHDTNSRNKILQYFDCGAEFKEKYFLSLDNSIEKTDPYTRTGNR